MDQCPRCGTEMNEGEAEVSFTDDFSDSNLQVDISAVWCDGCNYYKLSTE